MTAEPYNAKLNHTPHLLHATGRSMTAVPIKALPVRTLMPTPSLNLPRLPNLIMR